MVAFNPGSFQHGYPIFYRKQGYFVVLNFRKFVVKRDKNGQKCTKSSKKHPFFHTFIKVWIWPRPLPPLQCGKNPHFLFIFFLNTSVIGFNYGITSKRVKFHTFSVGSICLNEFTLLFYDFLTCGLLKHFWT